MNDYIDIKNPNDDDDDLLLYFLTYLTFSLYLIWFKLSKQWEEKMSKGVLP